jgi:hypothetical protein
VWAVDNGSRHASSAFLTGYSNINASSRKQRINTSMMEIKTGHDAMMIAPERLAECRWRVRHLRAVSIPQPGWFLVALVNGGLRRISPVGARPGKGLFSEPTTGVQRGGSNWSSCP